MLRSMYSGISGLKSFQIKLDVIGNNIANVNTTGFKKGRVIFKDIMSQTQAGASLPTAARGGTNSLQVGLGVELAAIETVQGSGSRQVTGRVLDLAIQGEGFFLVADGTATDDDGIIQETGEDAFNNILYTRSGNFYMDKNGYLVNAEGKYLVGVRADEYSVSANGDEGIDLEAKPDVSGADGENLIVDGVITPNEGNVGTIRIPTTAKSMNIGQDGTVSYVDYNGELKFAGQLIMAKFANAGGLEKSGSNYFQVTANSGDPFAQVATVAGMGTITSGALEMSNVDLSEEFTEMIVAQRGFQANTRIITTSDEILQELVNLKR